MINFKIYFWICIVDFNEDKQDIYRTPNNKNSQDDNILNKSLHHNALENVCPISLNKKDFTNNNNYSANNASSTNIIRKRGSGGTISDCNISLFVNTKTPKKKGMKRVFKRNTDAISSNVNINNNTIHGTHGKLTCNLGLIGPLSTSIQNTNQKNITNQQDIGDRGLTLCWH